METDFATFEDETTFDAREQFMRTLVAAHNMDLVQATQLSTTHSLLKVWTTLRALAFAKIEENDTNRQVPLGSTSQGRHMS